MSLSRATAQALTLGALLSLFAACAPRSGKTHFDRWADQTAQRKEEEAAEARAKEWLMAQSGGKAPASAPKTAEGKPAAHAPSHSSETPPVATSTRSSRVIRPENQPADDDDAIY